MCFGTRCCLPETSAAVNLCLPSFLDQNVSIKVKTHTHTPAMLKVWLGNDGKYMSWQHGYCRFLIPIMSLHIPTATKGEPKSEPFCPSSIHYVLRARVCTVGSTSTGAGLTGGSSGTLPTRSPKLYENTSFGATSSLFPFITPNYKHHVIQLWRTLSAYHQAPYGDDLSGGGCVRGLHAGQCFSQFQVYPSERPIDKWLLLVLLTPVME